MEITLTPNAKRFIEEQIQAGKYTSANDVIVTAIRLMEQELYKNVYKGRFEELKQEITIGAEQLDQGLKVDGQKVLKRLIEENQKASGA